MTCPQPIDRGLSAKAADGARIPKVRVRRLPSPLHRTDRHAVQRSAVPDRYRAARRALAAALQARPAGCVGTPAPAWLHHQPRDDPRLGVPLRAADQRRSSDAPPWSSWSVLVSGRDVREGRRPLVLPLPRDRSIAMVNCSTRCSASIATVPRLVAFSEACWRYRGGVRCV